MMKTNRFFAMAMALTMTASSIGTISAFADDETPVVESQTEETTAESQEEETPFFQPDGGYEILDDYTDQTQSLKPAATGINDPYLEKSKGKGADVIEQEVKDNVDTGVRRADKICVEIEWEDLNFVYDFGYVVEYYEWNPDKLIYEPMISEEAENPGWNKTETVFTIESRSNCPIWTGCSFTKNKFTKMYADVGVEFSPAEVYFGSAVGKSEEQINSEKQTITMTITGEPTYSAEYDKDNPPELGKIEFYVSNATKIKVEEPEPEPEPEPEVTEEEGGEHVCHFVYDQFGRLVCTGCNAVKHEYCIDEDEDGLCDECGLERDFCPDCHVGGKCVCT